MSEWYGKRTGQDPALELGLNSGNRQILSATDLLEVFVDESLDLC
jgi:hypothetical protein